MVNTMLNNSVPTVQPARGDELCVVETQKEQKRSAHQQNLICGYGLVISHKAIYGILFAPTDYSEHSPPF